MQISQINGYGGFPPATDVASSARSVATVSNNGSSVELPTQPQAVQAASAAVNGNQVKLAVADVNKVIKTLNASLEFQVDEATGMNVVKVVDTDNNEVIRQIPSEEVLVIAKAIDKLQGLIIRQKA